MESAVLPAKYYQLEIFAQKARHSQGCFRRDVWGTNSAVLVLAVESDLALCRYPYIARRAYYPILKFSQQITLTKYHSSTFIAKILLNM
jgi:hypothetical protein